MIGVIDYEAGNIASVENALRKIDCSFVVTNNIEQLQRCAGIILPGVGAAQGAMASLGKLSLTGFLTSCTVPFLGICVGMQLLYESSEEGATETLGVLPSTVKKFDSTFSKVPHMGWNNVTVKKFTPLMNNIENDSYFYFANSYYANVDDSTLGVTNCGIDFASIIQKENYFGVQFHPEKSGAVGLELLKNFEKLCSSYPR